MKKILILSASMFLLSAISFAQSTVRQGKFIIDPYAGIPNWGNAYLYSKYNTNNTDGEQSNVSNYKVNGSQVSYGGRIEYMFADKLGIGADVNYEVSGFNFDYEVFDTISSIATPFNYDYKAKKLRAMARINYHFVQNERVDAYVGFGGGYRHVSREAFATNTRTGESKSVDTKGFNPMTLRLAIGTRVYFTENIGAHIELGAFGGGILQFGISAKF